MCESLEDDRGLFGLGARGGLDGRGLDEFGLDGLRLPAKAGISNCRGCTVEGWRSLSLRSCDVGYGGDCWSGRMALPLGAPLLEVLLQRLVAELGHLVGVIEDALELERLSPAFPFVKASVPRVWLGVPRVDVLPGDTALFESTSPTPVPTLETDERLGVLADIGVALRNKEPVSALVFLRGIDVAEEVSMLQISTSSLFRISLCKSSVSAEEATHLSARAPLFLGAAFTLCRAADQDSRLSITAFCLIASSINAISLDTSAAQAGLGT